MIGNEKWNMSASKNKKKILFVVVITLVVWLFMLIVTAGASQIGLI
jgi:hypothetical protein